MLLKGEVGGRALDSHGYYIVDHGKSWENHRIVFLNFCGNPVAGLRRLVLTLPGDKLRRQQAQMIVKTFNYISTIVQSKIFEPAHEILVLIVWLNDKDSDKLLQMRRLSRPFAARAHRV